MSERRVRPAVILRRLCFGTESPEDSRFVERMLTIATTLRQQDGNVLDYMIAAHRVRLNGHAAPSIRPA